MDRLWAVEPDQQSLNHLRLAEFDWPSALQERVTIIDAVLADEKGKQRFHSGLGYASQISETGASLRDVTTIDALGIDPTVIKLHLEGAELSALKGALETIRKHRPLVMLTVYHDAAGLIETPRWLMLNLDDYEILMRSHSFCGTGAVIYAIPKERLA